MRALFLLLLGLALGVFAGLSIARQASLMRAYPRGVMNVLQHHLTTARNELKRGERCDPAALTIHLRALGQFAPEVDAALNPPGAERDPQLDLLQRHLLETLEPTRSLSDLANCAALSPGLIPEVEHRCRDCHQAYR